jgi:hypothetical protein
MLVTENSPFQDEQQGKRALRSYWLGLFAQTNSTDSTSLTNPWILVLNGLLLLALGRLAGGVSGENLSGGVTLRRLAILGSMALVAVALLLGGSQPAVAGVHGSVTGGGSIGNYTFVGAVRSLPGGGATGRFQVVLHRDRMRIVCRWDTFSNLDIVGSMASFDALGVCTGPFGPFLADNHFTVWDNGEPGAGVDAIDVNMNVSPGITVPGGFIDGGNLQVR